MGARLSFALLLAVSGGLVLHSLVPAATHRVQEANDGTFAPESLEIRSGDTIEWMFSARTQSVITAREPAKTPGVCPLPREFSPDDPGIVAGPLPFAPSGIFSLAPLEERGLRVVQDACPGGRSRFAANGSTICPTGPPLTTMDETWTDPANTGVFIRLLWNRLQRAPGTSDASFDFTDLDREISQAVRHGKLYSLAVKAGQDGTPDWIFDNGVTRLVLQDGGSGADRNPNACGPRMTLGSPTDPAFERHYFDMLSKVAAHIRSRADWYRALAYIKPSGANLFSHENRLPKRCSPGCICNPQVFAAAGYRPSKLYDFYRRQFGLLKREFPGKALSYQLIQDGFPLVNESGGYERADGSSSDGRPLPEGVEQTERILDLGQRELGSLFAVQHNGLQAWRGDCEETPARRGGGRGRAAIRANRGLGCPNGGVLGAGADGKTITGFQTQNTGEIADPADVDLALKNAWENSKASFVELYEAPLWLAIHGNGGLLPGGKTIRQWADAFHERRRREFSSMGDPFPATLRHTFTGVRPGTITYFDPSTCRTGSIVVTQ